MAKEKLTDETIVIACHSSDCDYNEKNLCKLQEIMIDELGGCIYKHVSSCSEG